VDAVSEDEPDIVIADEASSLPGYINLKEVCLFCGNPAKLTEGKKRGYDVYTVRDDSFQTAINNIILTRNDEWAHETQARINNQNLFAVSATYHQPCNVNFRTKKQVPLRFANGGKKIKKGGRPVNESKNMAFQKVIDYITCHDGEAMLMSELSSLMQRECIETDGFTNQYLKKKLLEHFGSEITIISKNGCSDLVLFR